MLKKANLDALRKGVGDWNEWRQQNSASLVDLSSLTANDCRNLTGADFRNCVFHKNKLSGTHFKDVTFDDCFFLEVELTEARIENCSLKSAQLRQTDLSSSELKSSDLTNSGLIFCPLEKAMLNNCILADTLLYECSLNKAAVKNSDFVNAGLYQVLAVSTHFRGNKGISLNELRQEPDGTRLEAMLEPEQLKQRVEFVNRRYKGPADHLEDLLIHTELEIGRSGKYIKKVERLGRSSEAILHKFEVKARALRQKEEELTEQKRQQAETERKQKAIEERINRELSSTNRPIEAIRQVAVQWKNTSTRYEQKGNGFATVAAFLACALVVLIWFYIKQGGFAGTLNSEVAKASLQQVLLIIFKNGILLGILVSVGVLLIRFLIRLSVSSYHLSRDAYERMILADFYKDFEATQKKDLELRVVAYKALFSRSETGLLRREERGSSPTVNLNAPPSWWNQP